MRRKRGIRPQQHSGRNSRILIGDETTIISSFILLDLMNQGTNITIRRSLGGIILGLTFGRGVFSHWLSGRRGIYPSSCVGGEVGFATEKFCFFLFLFLYIFKVGLFWVIVIAM